jgi:hypothetical protein
MWFSYTLLGECTERGGLVGPDGTITPPLSGMDLVKSKQQVTRQGRGCARAAHPMIGLLSDKLT